MLPAFSKACRDRFFPPKLDAIMSSESTAVRRYLNVERTGELYYYRNQPNKTIPTDPVS
jgi:hypothetical protein